MFFLSADPLAELVICPVHLTVPRVGCYFNSRSQRSHDLHFGAASWPLRLPLRSATSCITSARCVLTGDREGRSRQRGARCCCGGSREKQRRLAYQGIAPDTLVLLYALLYCSPPVAPLPGHGDRGRHLWCSMTKFSK